MSEACCTCAALLSSIPPTYDEKTEKPSQFERRLDCCDRAICARCLTDNPRFQNYCPYCQISTGPSALPTHGLRDPPTYSPPDEQQAGDELPPYSAHNALQPPLEKTNSDAENAPDVLHFVDQNNDSILSLSLRYGVPADALRRTNNLYADHLLAARRTVLIPGEFYKGGVSLSPRPLEGEEEEIKKTKLRKFMVRCKVAEYDVALLYLEQADYNLEHAITAYKADEEWEKEHSLEAAKKGKAKDTQSSGRRKWGFGGLTGQL
ncbi:unnamed protein product [Alternaria alternata]|jgi:hypothetical protein|uniref:LysM domain-containing protein n=2 Tax=Alternaria alternata complex TaxID=187734 RepID=A0A177DYA0_ALTAL|nr:hypothetical protein CC77DRAFT_1029022 [Alternaria alternata]XP_051591730.1 uncharacterized protein J4E82_002013 [Alternaria postmessia]RII05694.1 hypothetical protein CUC08_Gglean008909 [Alternaria sp. MG1]RYN23040.1 hypothetical protein AA0115_g8934 [Alternaria tenuissima]KAI5379027.1 hypothetical protein J4E82_002013 [Alternaria postmessia]OAG24150.1 hypothetical protein CC77DRAFT_1029022 [Alternaria alternata]RYN67368.1 hypothetical protein AA0117_g11573 [Alternaria alternata]